MSLILTLSSLFLMWHDSLPHVEFKSEELKQRDVRTPKGLAGVIASVAKCNLKAKAKSAERFSLVKFTQIRQPAFHIVCSYNAHDFLYSYERVGNARQS